MRNLSNLFARAASVAAMTAVLFASGCKKNNEGPDGPDPALTKAALEAAAASDALIRSFTPVEGSTDKWEVEFTSGLTTKTENLTGIKALTDNHDGTVTVEIEGADPFTFERGSTATYLEITSTDMEGIIAGGTGTITFKTTPATAWIHTTGDGDMTKWALIGLGNTRAGEAIPSENFSIQSVEATATPGEYVADVKCEKADMGSEYQLVLDLNAGATAKPSMVSSPSFSIGISVPSGVIKLMTTAYYEIEPYIAGEGEVTIDWGDGSAVERGTLRGFDEFGELDARNGFVEKTLKVSP